MSTLTNACAVCGKSFKRLQSHLAHILACKSFYMSRVNAAAIVAPTIPNDSVVNTTNPLQGANRCTFPNSRTSLCESSATVRGEAEDPLHNVKDMNAAVEDGNFVMFHDSIYLMAILAIRIPPKKMKMRKVLMSVCWICVWNCSICEQTQWDSCIFLRRRRFRRRRSKLSCWIS